MSKQIGNVEVSVNTYSDVLQHHGILGMKWGVRRYQNADGTLTEAGRKRYQNSDGSPTKAGRKRFYSIANKSASKTTAQDNAFIQEYNKGVASSFARTKKENLDRLMALDEVNSILGPSRYSFTGALGTPSGNWTLYTSSPENGVNSIRFMPSLGKYKSSADLDRTIDDGVHSLQRYEAKLKQYISENLGDRWDRDDPEPADTSRWKLLSLEIFDSDGYEPTYVVNYDDNGQYGYHLLSCEFDKKGKIGNYGFDG